MGCTVGPLVAPRLDRSVGAFVRLGLGGGYFRAVFVAESLLALFDALDVAFPILDYGPIAYIEGGSCITLHEMT